ncbi:MAG: hypothetical protein ABJH63_13715 [Rhizobiaceae bacterium]
MKLRFLRIGLAKPLALLLATVAVGCHHKKVTTVPINLDYARTNLGYRNSGLIDAGSLYFWDMKENELVSLARDIPLTERKSSSTTSIEAKNIQGIEIGLQADIPRAVTGQIKAAIRNNYIFLVNKANKATSSKRFDAISKTYTQLRESGQDPYFVWRVSDLVSDPGRYKLVLAESPVYAESESLQFQSGGDGSISVQSPNNEKLSFDVKAPKERSAKCSGSPAQCFINLLVIDVRLKDSEDESGNPVRTIDYRPSRGIDREKLPEALRKLA